MAIKDANADPDEPRGRPDRRLTTLERLLAIEATDLPTALARAAELVRKVLGGDKVDVFLHEPAADCLRAIGVSEGSMARRERALGLDRLPLAAGGRAAHVFRSGVPHRNGRVDRDPEELAAIKEQLGVRSALAVPLKVNTERRGVVLVASARAGAFSEADLRFLEAVARWVGMLAHRAELVERAVQEAAGRERARVEERERIAMDLHDGAIQALYGVALGLAGAVRSLDGGTPAREILRRAITDIEGVIRDIRAYIYELRPPELAQRGLRGGIEALAEQFRGRAGIDPELDLTRDAEGLLGVEALGHVLAITREALSNVTRHAGASSTTIRLTREEGQILLTIRDNGRGFDPERAGEPGRDGLRNMADRARMLGASLAVVSRPGSGTEIRLEAPVSERRGP